MQFCFSKVDALPRLSWCAILRRGEATVEVQHGPWVEVRKDWFCEGAWDGDFPSGQLADAILIGSGGQLTDAGVLFAAPNHTLERLYVLDLPEAVLVSNSLSFVLCQANDALDTEYPFYRQDLRSMIYGLQKYTRTIPTRNGHRLALYYHCNLTLDGQGQITETPKQPAPAFSDFAAYKAFLLETIQALHSNATDAKRQIHYAPITSISSGYDSPAAAVLAGSVGCREALTFRTSRQIKETAWKTQDDSGGQIAQRLGMRVTEYQRRDYLHIPGFPDAEFAACGPNSADVVMLPWEKDVERRLLFSGFHGDKVWDVNNPKVSPDIVRGDPSGSTLAEFRLRVGFLHLPVPFLGCTSHPAIDRISHAEEMRPWRLGNDYDRPIPRRLVEEAGVERQWFGQEKRAVTAPLFGAELQGKELGEVSMRDFLAFYRAHRSTFECWLMAAIRGFYKGYLYSAPGLNTVLPWLGVKRRAPLTIPAILRYDRWGICRGTEAMLNQWAFEKIKSRYQVAGTFTHEERRMSHDVL